MDVITLCPTSIQLCQLLRAVLWKPCPEIGAHAVPPSLGVSYSLTTRVVACMPGWPACWLPAPCDRAEQDKREMHSVVQKESRERHEDRHLEKPWEKLGLGWRPDQSELELRLGCRCIYEDTIKDYISYWSFSFGLYSYGPQSGPNIGSGVTTTQCSTKQ